MKKENFEKYLRVPFPCSQKLMGIEGYDDNCFAVMVDDVCGDVYAAESWYDDHRSEIEGED